MVEPTPFRRPCGFPVEFVFGLTTRPRACCGWGQAETRWPRLVGAHAPEVFRAAQNSARLSGRINNLDRLLQSRQQCTPSGPGHFGLEGVIGAALRQASADASAVGDATAVPAPPSLPDFVGEISSTEDGATLPSDPFEVASPSRLASQRGLPPQDELEMLLIPFCRSFLASLPHSLYGHEALTGTDAVL